MVKKGEISPRGRVKIFLLFHTVGLSNYYSLKHLKYFDLSFIGYPLNYVAIVEAPIEL